MKKIVVVDDDESILDITKTVLEEEGYKVETHTTGEILYNIDDSKPDLVLLDIMLAGEDGRDICKFLKSKKSTQNISVILFSAHAKDNLADDIAKACPDYFINKPFDIYELVEVVNSIIKN